MTILLALAAITAIILTGLYFGCLYIPKEGVRIIYKGGVIHDFYDSMDGTKWPLKIAGPPLLKRAGETIDSQIELILPISDVEVGKNWPSLAGTDEERAAEIEKERSRVNFSIQISAELNTSDPATFVKFLKRYFIVNTVMDGKTVVSLKTTTEALQDLMQSNVSADLKRQMASTKTSDAESADALDFTELNAKLQTLGIRVIVSQYTIADMNPTAEDMKRRESEDAVIIAKNLAKAATEEAVGIKAKSEAAVAGDIAKRKASLENRAAFVVAAKNAGGKEAAVLAMLAESEHVTIVTKGSIAISGD